MQAYLYIYLHIYLYIYTDLTLYFSSTFFTLCLAGASFAAGQQIVAQVECTLTF